MNIRTRADLHSLHKYERNKCLNLLCFLTRLRFILSSNSNWFYVFENSPVLFNQMDQQTRGRESHHKFYMLWFGQWKDTKGLPFSNLSLTLWSFDQTQSRALMVMVARANIQTQEVHMLLYFSHRMIASFEHQNPCCSEAQKWCIFY